MYILSRAPRTWTGPATLPPPPSAIATWIAATVPSGGMPAASSICGRTRRIRLLRDQKTGCGPAEKLPVSHQLACCAILSSYEPICPGHSPVPSCPPPHRTDACDQRGADRRDSAAGDDPDGPTAGIHRQDCAVARRRAAAAWNDGRGHSQAVHLSGYESGGRGSAYGGNRDAGGRLYARGDAAGGRPGGALAGSAWRRGVCVGVPVVARVYVPGADAGRVPGDPLCASTRGGSSA